MIDLRHGDNFWVLPMLAPNSVDAFVTDPPSGIGFLGTDWDSDKGGRRQWIAYMAVRFRRALEVLKPGAHGVVWALPRTSHWTATALEDAGFEIRDVITHVFGQGMPKSLGVSKAIDKAAGATRPVVGTRTLTGNAALSTKEKGGTYGVDVGTAPAKEVPVTAPATDEARAWDGWGTALKPASEHWILVRKPLESTVAANALKHGTGGINIDGCRIGWDPTSLAKDTARRAKPRTDIRGGSIHAGGGKPGGFIGDAESPKGRWPSNFSLEHHHDCELVGMKKVRGSNLAGPAPKAGPAWFDGAGFEHQAGAARARGQELAPDGFETVENWKCVEGCPVRTLDEQSGERPGMSGGGKHRSDYDGGLFGGIDSTTTARGDTGGASRFFYCGKATRAERGDDNDHPTVKPIELVRYLIRLVTPPGGTVLDIFMGSGTTGIAAVAEGVSFIGIDDQEKNVAIARSRLIADSPLFAAAGGVR